MQDESEFVYSKLGIMETEHYVVHVGTVPGDKVPQYLVFNKQHSVLEFAHNMIYFVKEALQEMEEKLEAQELELSGAEPNEDDSPKVEAKPKRKRVVN